MKEKKAAKSPEDYAMIRVKKEVKEDVERFVVGTKYTIGTFFEIAAQEKLKRQKPKSLNA